MTDAIREWNETLAGHWQSEPVSETTATVEIEVRNRATGEVRRAIAFDWCLAILLTDAEPLNDLCHAVYLESRGEQRDFYDEFEVLGNPDLPVWLT